MIQMSTKITLACNKKIFILFKYQYTHIKEKNVYNGITDIPCFMPGTVDSDA